MSVIRLENSLGRLPQTRMREPVNFSLEAGEHIAVMEIRKHWASYFKGLPNFKPFKMRLMETLEVSEVFAILEEIEACY